MNAYFPSNMRKLRKSRKLTQHQVADALGIHYHTLQSYEQGRRWPSVPALMKIADFYDVGIDMLVGRD